MRNLKPGKGTVYNDAFKGYGYREVVLWDIFSIQDGENLKISFESVSSPWRQGVWMKTDTGITVNAIFCPSVVLWADAVPGEIPFQCRSKDGCLSIYNIWDSGHGTRSQSHSSGMLVEEIAQGFRYRCNDIGFDTKFHKLVFRIERA
jgi:hypothetical protein